MRADRRVPRRALNRQAAPQQKPAQRDEMFLAPSAGLVLSQPLAAPNRQAARVLENWFPTLRGARARGGSTKYATLSATSEPVESLWSYITGSAERFFGACDGSIYNITTVADPDAVPSADVTGQTSDYYSTTQLSNIGGTDYLYAVNGTDSPQLYDGSTWTAITGASSPAITGVTTSDLSFVWTFASRLWFVEKDTQSVWYLPVDSIGGAATEFSLATVFRTNSPVLFAGRWSADTGDGMDDRCVFVSERGEVAVYEGTDPSVAADWRLVGVYQTSTTLGKNATTHIGGDFVIGCQDGLVPMSQVISKDPAALNLAAVTHNIDELWHQEASIRTLPWEVLKLDVKNMMVVSLPVTAATDLDRCFVANMETGAWSVFTGWNTRCLGKFGDSGYFGTDDGIVLTMEQGGSDNGTAYTCAISWYSEHFGAAGAYKQPKQARAIYRSSVNLTDKITTTRDYNEALPAPPSSVAEFMGEGWDVGLWDTAIWDDGGEAAANVTTRWRSVFGPGYSIAPQLQITFGVTGTPNVELVQLDMTYEPGGLVV
jgi:hypothetical protein